MSRGLSLLFKLPTILRTLKWIKPAQARAQLQHMLFGLSPPARLSGPAPDLAVASGSVDFLPPPAHVRAMGSKRIELVGSAFEIGDRPNWTTQEHGPLFAYHLHQHEYLRTNAFSPSDRECLLIDWIDRHPAGVGWDPHPISLRLLCWGKMLTTSGALALGDSARERILSSMADQAETLARGLEVRLQANHLLSNLLSVVWAGVLLECEASERWRAVADRLVAEIEAQIHPDGGHEERSPMYHSLLLENMLDLLNLLRAEPARAPAGLVKVLESATSRMLTALQIWTHPDGEIALFADSGFDVAASPASLMDYASRLDVRGSSGVADAGESCVLSQSGYVRLVARDIVLVASSSGPAPAHQPGHAHCDALAFELSVGGRRVITDTGLFEYRTGPRRERARSTASHSTLQIDGEEQFELWSAHRVGGRPEVQLLGWDGAGMAAASCRGWSRPGTTHRRRFSVEAGVATIEDEIEGGCQSIRFCLPIDPAWEVEFADASLDARLTQPASEDGPALRVDLELPDPFRWRLASGPYYPSFGREVERALLIGEGAAFEHSRLRIRLRS